MNRKLSSTMPTRRRLIGAAAAVSLPFAYACSGNNNSGLLTASDVHRDNYPTVTAVKWLGEALKKETNGKLSIRSYHSGQLGAEDDTIALAQSGVIDICRVNSAALNNAFPLTQSVALPFAIEDDAHLHRVLDGAIGQEILEGFKARGLIGLAAYDAGGRSFYNALRPIEKPSDLHGLKIRVPQSDLFIETVGAMGANPTPLTVSAVYSSLQSRLIDGAENNWPTYESSRHLEVAHYLSLTRHSYSPEFLLMSQHSFDRLTRQEQSLVIELARQSVPVMREAWVKTETTSREKALAAGTKVTEVDRSLFKRASEPVLRARLQKDARVDRLYNTIKAMV